MVEVLAQAPHLRTVQKDTKDQGHVDAAFGLVVQVAVAEDKTPLRARKPQFSALRWVVRRVPVDDLRRRGNFHVQLCKKRPFLLK